MTRPRDHVPELDGLKGLAILCVVCIHAQLGAGHVLFDRVANRAVPIFLVLFGITSELWWDRREAFPKGRAVEFYRSRLRRIVPPVWAFGAVWWIYAFATGTLERLDLGLSEAVLTSLGYSPWVGASWFVTLILELVLLYPVLRFILRKAGAPAALTVSAAICATCIYYLWSIVLLGRQWLGGKVPDPGWYYDWIFPPRAFWNVLAGATLARVSGGRMSKHATAIAVFVTLVGAVLAIVVRGPPEDIFGGTLREQAVTYVFDVPLALALLGLVRWIPLPKFLLTFLAWCGLSSWGIYLGHLLVHEMVHMSGYEPESGPTAVRAVYALFLFVSGALLTVTAAGAETLALRGLHRLFRKSRSEAAAVASTGRDGP